MYRLCISQSQEGANHVLQAINGMTTGTMDGATIISPATHTVQAITMADGNTAFIQHTGRVQGLNANTVLSASLFKSNKNHLPLKLVILILR